MKYFFLIISISLSINFVIAQEQQQQAEQSLEFLTENGEDADIDDDSYQLLLEQYAKNKLPINTCTAADLKELKILNPLQINQFINYRNLMGSFIDIHELQAIPNWDINLIDKIKLFFKIDENINIKTLWKNKLTQGNFTLTARINEVLEKSKGYLNGNTVGSKYLGSPQKIWTRFRYQNGNDFSYGLLAEKDAGEQFFKGNNNGFDFYNAHFFLRTKKVLQTIAIGDYTVNLGQGLTSWQSLAFKKSPDVLNIKRESQIIKPYLSAGEFNFNRGIATTFNFKKFYITTFFSHKKLDANTLSIDSLNEDERVSGFLTSGFHRTTNELNDKNSQRQTSFGGNLKYVFKNGHLGFNSVNYTFQKEIQKESTPYQLYALKGKQWQNKSIDYDYTFKNIHFFGELASSNNKGVAVIQGALISLSQTVAASFLYRNINPSYQSLYSSAFTESSTPSNEKGFYVGINIKLSQNWKLDAYIDNYASSWLRYRVNAPSNGKDFLLSITYKPSSKLECYTRLRTENKAVNESSELINNIVQYPINKIRTNWRTHFSYKISPTFTIKQRVEVLWWDTKGLNPEKGFLTYFDIAYKPMLSKLSFSARFQYFATDGYNSRLYAYENDVLYSYSIPVFYNKGIRYYLNANYDISKKLTIWARAAQINYDNRKTIGTGLDEIIGNKKTDWKLQIQWRF